MTGRGKNITPEFAVGKSRLFFPDAYVKKESARAITKRFVGSKCYDGKSYYYKVIQKDNKLIILDTKGNIVFPKKCFIKKSILKNTEPF